MIKFVLAQSDIALLMNKIKSIFEVEGYKTHLQKLVRICMQDGLVSFSSMGQNMGEALLKLDKDSKFIDGEVVCCFDDLYGWIKSQKGSHVALNFKESKNKHSVGTNSGDSEKDENSDIFLVGKVHVVSKDKSGNASKWNLDCFEVINNRKINFSKITEKFIDREVFSCQSDVLLSACKKVSTCSKTHNVYSNLCFHNKGNLSISCTDSIRCAIGKVKQATVFDNFNTEFLVNSSHIVKILNGIRKQNLRFFHFKEKNCLFIIGEDFNCRLILPPIDVVKQYPNVFILDSLPYDKTFFANKVLLKNSVSPLKQVNSTCVALKVNSGETTCILKAMSEYGKSPMTSMINIDISENNFSSVLAIDHLIDVLGVITGESIQLLINKKVVMMKDRDDDDFSYFTMCISNPIYKDFLEG